MHPPLHTCVVLLVALLSAGLTAQQAAPALPSPAVVASAAAATLLGRVHVDRPDGDTGAVWVRGGNYKASVDGTAFTFLPYPGADEPRSLPIEFRVQAVRLAGALLDAAPAGVDVAGQCITVRRSSFAEVYDARTDGVKQSFCFERLPQRGELDIVLGVTSERHGAADGRDLVFTSPHGPVRYSDLVVVDADGDRLALPIEWRNDEVHLVVPASFVEQASLPLVVDPLVTSTTVSPASSMQMYPDVAFDETVGEHLVVWQEPFTTNDWDVAAMRCDAFMNPIGVPFFIDFTSENWTGPRVACKTPQGMFLVVAQASNGLAAPFSIRGRRFEAIGTTRTLHAQFDIHTPTMAGGLAGQSFKPDVGADPWPGGPAFFVVVWEHQWAVGDHDIAFRRVNADGSFPNAPLILNGGPNHDQEPSISKSSSYGVYGIAWTQYGPWGTDGHITAAVIDYLGGLRVPPFYVDSSNNNDTRPRISTAADLPTGHAMLVTWERNYDPFGTSGALHCAAIRDTAPALYNRWNLSLLLGMPPGTQAFQPTVDSDGLRFAVAHTEVLPASGRSDTRASTLAFDGQNLLVHEARVPLLTSGPQGFTPSIASRYGGGLYSSRSYGVVCGTNAITVAGWLYNGHAPGAWWTPRAAGCGGLVLTYGGYPVFGHSVDFDVAGTDPFKGILLGFPSAATPIPACSPANCTVAVTQPVTVPSPYHWTIPYVPSLVGVTFTAQGFSLGPSGTCLGMLRLSNAVDFTLR